MIGIAIYLLLPLVGAVVFAALCLRMARMQIAAPPYFSIFALFAIFGGWLVVLLTDLFWHWSGMATLGVFFLVLAGPLATAGLAFGLHRRRPLSVFHRAAYLASIAYSGLVVTMLGARFVIR